MNRRHIAAVTAAFVLFVIWGIAAAQQLGDILIPGAELEEMLDDPTGRAHPFWTPADVEITLLISSSSFDPYLILIDPEGQVIAQSGRLTAPGKAMLSVRTETAGWHRVVASARGGVGSGPYNINLELGDHELQESVAPQAELPSAAAPTPGPSPAGPPPQETIAPNNDLSVLPYGEWVSHHVDVDESQAVYTFMADAGEKVWLRMIGQDFDPHLTLIGPGGTVIVETNGNHSSLDAHITAELPESGTYIVEVGVFGDDVQDGSYWIRLDEISTLHSERNYITPWEGGISPSESVRVVTRKVEAGQVLFASLRSSDFHARLDLFDESGSLLNSAQDSSEMANAMLGFHSMAPSTVIIEAKSHVSGEGGAYQLDLWTVPVEDAHHPWDELPSFVITVEEESHLPPPAELPLGEMVVGHLTEHDDFLLYQVEVIDESGGLDLWLFSDYDLDLAVGTFDPAEADWWQTLSYFQSESSGPTGYKHVRVPLEDDGHHAFIQLTGWFSGPLAPFALFAQLFDEDDPPFPHSWFDHSQFDTERAHVPLAGRLLPGQRQMGRIDPMGFETQTWVFELPEGVESVEIRLYEATADLDLSLSKGWMPGPYGEGHHYIADTLRNNERLVVEAADGEPLHPGLYTIAVWSVYPNAPVDYEIAIAFDEPLPAPISYPFLSPHELESLSSLQRAQFATVEITGWYSDGSGAVITADGLILTNFHAIAPCDPLPSLSDSDGCRGNPGDLPLDPQFDELIISLTDEDLRQAVQTFLAQVIDTEPGYDLALLEIAFDLDGNPLDELQLPYVEFNLNHEGDEEGMELPGLARPISRFPERWHELLEARSRDF